MIPLNGMRDSIQWLSQGFRRLQIHSPRLLSCSEEQFIQLVSEMKVIASFLIDIQSNLIYSLDNLIEVVQNVLSGTCPP